MLAALLLAQACGSSGGADEPSDEAGLSDGAFDSIEGMRQRSDQAPISPEDVVLILRAFERSTAGCMADHGFSNYPMMSEYMVPSAPPYLSPAELRRSGYQYDWEAAGDSFLAANPPGGPPSPTAGMSQAEADAYLEALAGPSDSEMVVISDLDGGTVGGSGEGCGAEANIELYGSFENGIRFNRALEQIAIPGISQELRDHDEYEDALAEWQNCMVEAGFDVSDSTDYGLGYLQSRGAQALQGSGDISAEVITATAIADADCQESSGLFEVRDELLPDATDAAAAGLGFEMSQYIAFQHAVLERAKRVP